MSSKIRVLVLVGGRSAEHEISLRSARNVLDALDRSRYEVETLRIDREGRWHRIESSAALARLEELERSGAAPIPAPDSSELVPRRAAIDARERVLLPEASRAFDVVFPVMHGPAGEDGSIQGFLRVAGLPCVGPDLLGSAVGMDKDVSKRLLAHAGIAVSPHVCVTRAEARRFDLAELCAGLAAPYFVKPANMGSSVGVTRVTGVAGLAGAVAEALRYDHKVVIEEEIRGRELECAVLGGEDLRASVVGEILTGGAHEFYSYDAKYMDEAGAGLVIPAELAPGQSDAIRSLSIATCRALCIQGMARVDVFLTPAGELFVNEVNTIPGFTDISMYPRLWEATGLPYSQLLDELIELALARAERDRGLSLLPPATPARGASKP